MPENDTVQRWGTGVEITPPVLSELTFSLPTAPVKLPEGGFNISYDLGVQRFARLQLGVVFGAELADIPDLTVRAAYRMIFTLRPESPEATDPEKAFSLIVARMAPVTMYPFVREALASVAQKAMLPPLILPVQNVGLLWETGEIELPAPPEEAAAASATGEE